MVKLVTSSVALRLVALWSPQLAVPLLQAQVLVWVLPRIVVLAGQVQAQARMAQAQDSPM